MSVTRPSRSSKLIRSPIRIGCEIAIWMPAIRLASVRWAAKPTIATTSAVEARTPRRRRRRSRVLVVRETCETAGDMEGKLATPPVAEPTPRIFPPSNWGPKGALLGAVMAIFAGLLLGMPALFFTEGEGDLTTAGNVIAQVGTVLGLLLV